jgi:hypothetical protein
MNIMSGQGEDPTVLVRETIGLLRRVRISAMERAPGQRQID